MCVPACVRVCLRVSYIHEDEFSVGTLGVCVCVCACVRVCVCVKPQSYEIVIPPYVGAGLSEVGRLLVAMATLVKLARL